MKEIDKKTTANNKGQRILSGIVAWVIVPVLAVGSLFGYFLWVGVSPYKDKILEHFEYNNQIYKFTIGSTIDSAMKLAVGMVGITMLTMLISFYIGKWAKQKKLEKENIKSKTKE